jgi:hypothetical protein
MKKFIFVVFLTSLSPNLNSCSISDQEKISWAIDYENGLHQTVNAGGYTFDLQYQPLWLKNLLEPTNASTDTITQHYVLEISVDSGKQGIEEYTANSIEQIQEREYYFTYAFENDIFLIDGNEELPCVLFHYESSGSISNVSRFILGFENKKASREATLVIQTDYLNAIPTKIKIKKTEP